MLDQLFYHTKCAHCIKVLHTLHEMRMDDQLQFVCLDRRVFDQKTRLPVAVLANGALVPVPVHVNSVPTLLFRSKNNTILVGASSIISHFKGPGPVPGPLVGTGAEDHGPVPAASGGSSIGGVKLSESNTSLRPIAPEVRGSERLREGSVDIEAIKARRDADLDEVSGNHTRIQS